MYREKERERGKEIVVRLLYGNNPLQCNTRIDAVKIKTKLQGSLARL